MIGIITHFFLFYLLILTQSFFLNDYGFYDILLVWILFYFTTEEEYKLRVFTLCLLAGYIKDATSGGVFGVYFSSYFWYLIILFVTSRFLNIKNYLFMLFLGMCGIVIEGVFIILSNYIWVFTPSIANDLYKGVLKEMLFAVISFIPLYFALTILRSVSLQIVKFFKKKLLQLGRI